MTQVAIEALLKQKIGLDAKTIGSNAIARVVRQRMADCQLSDTTAYLKRLQTSSEELEALIELVIVPETWFFRDREPFNFLTQYVKSEWLPASQGGVLRVLSVPCSTGEEPYSIAIALMQAGLAPKNFHIDAVDISKKSLLKAQRGIYDTYSFRTNTQEFRDRYFQQTPAGFQLNSSVRNSVNFIHGNLLDPLFIADKVPYDVIFCRNLLIYFDNPAREQTLKVLDRLLTPKGLLFVGHSETGQILAFRFVPVRHFLAFAYRKLEEGGKKQKVTQSRPTHSAAKASGRQSPFLQKEKANATASRASAIAQLQATTNRLSQNSKLSEANLAPQKPCLLETAKTLADAGRLDEAMALCKTYLSQNRASAEAYVLLGAVHQAAGKEEQAEQCFQKAIYLDPNDYEALIYLALLKEHRGEVAEAAVLRQRIKRLDLENRNVQN